MSWLLEWLLLTITIWSDDSRSILVRRVNLRWRDIAEHASNVVARDDLHEVSGFDVPDLDKGRLESKDEGVVHGWNGIKSAPRNAWILMSCIPNALG